MTNEPPTSANPTPATEAEEIAAQASAIDPAYRQALAFEEFQPQPPAAPEPPMPAAVIRRHWAVRDLILDYAIGNALIGLNPIPGTLTLTFLLGSVLVLLMMRHIGRKWGFPKGQDGLAVMGNIFGGIGAFAIALMAWLTFFTLGLVLPIMRTFDIAAALFTFTWAVGQVTHQYYLSGRLKEESR